MSAHSIPTQLSEKNFFLQFIKLIRNVVVVLLAIASTYQVTKEKTGVFVG